MTYELSQEVIDLLKQDEARRAKQDAFYVAKQRERQGMESWLPVSLTANYFGVTPRRIRAQLAAGRLAGRQLENGYWEVAYPYRVAMGRRGPRRLLERPKKVELKLV
jgi:hypothetical protein